MYLQINIDLSASRAVSDFSLHTLARAGRNVLPATFLKKILDERVSSIRGQTANRFIAKRVSKSRGPPRTRSSTKRREQGDGRVSLTRGENLFRREYAALDRDGCCDSALGCVVTDGG